MIIPSIGIKGAPCACMDGERGLRCKTGSSFSEIKSILKGDDEDDPSSRRSSFKRVTENTSK